MSQSLKFTLNTGWFFIAMILTSCYQSPQAPENNSSASQSAKRDEAESKWQPSYRNNQPAVNNDTKRCNNQTINNAFNAQNPNQKIQVLGCGQVIKQLKDDTQGSRHQKFLVRLDGYPKITVLIAHNIDLAPRINELQVNTPIQFYGEYIYNDKGGVVHWTHKDPAARHQNGWLKYRGQQYW